MSQVLFAVILTVCTVSNGEKKCIEEPAPGHSSYIMKSACSANINTAEKARKIPHNGETVQGFCRASYSQPVKAKHGVKRKPVAAVKPKAESRPQPTTLTATAELCGLRNGKKTRTCLKHEEEGFKDRSACIARAQEMMKDSRLAFGYARIPPPYQPKVRCLGVGEIAAPEATEPIIEHREIDGGTDARSEPTETSGRAPNAPGQLPSATFNWPWYGLVALVAILGVMTAIRIYRVLCNETAPGSGNPSPAARNPVVRVRRANKSTGMKK